MDSKELAIKVVNDLRSTPQLVEGLKKEVEGLINKIIIDNAKEIINIKSEDDFFSFMAEVIDILIPLPQPWESLDGVVIKVILKKVVDGLLDKYFGDNWYEKLTSLINANKTG